MPDKELNDITKAVINLLDKQADTDLPENGTQAASPTTPQPTPTPSQQQKINKIDRDQSQRAGQRRRTRIRRAKYQEDLKKRDEAYRAGQTKRNEAYREEISGPSYDFERWEGETTDPAPVFPRTRDIRTPTPITAKSVIDNLDDYLAKQEATPNSTKNGAQAATPQPTPTPPLHHSLPLRLPNNSSNSPNSSLINNPPLQRKICGLW